MEYDKRVYERLKITEEYAMLSKGHGNRNSGFGCRVAATIWIKSKMIAWGINSEKTSPFQAKYGVGNICCPHIFSPIYFHAEIAAIAKAVKNVNPDKLKKASMYIVRLKKQPNNSRQIFWGLSKPCPICMGAIIEFGIRRVYWSLDEDVIGNRLYNFMDMRYVEIEA